MSEYAPVQRDGRHSQALVFYCSDPDFRPAFTSFINGLGVKKYDSIVEPGPSMVIVQDPKIAERAATLRTLHFFPKAVILDHINCGWFNIADETTEQVKHFQFAKPAEEVLQQAMPGLEVEYHLLGWNGEIVPHNQKA